MPPGPCCPPAAGLPAPYMHTLHRPPYLPAAALTHLCALNRMTCWMGGECEEAGLCYLMDAEGRVQKQGCSQRLRFVCRQKSEYQRCDDSSIRTQSSRTTCSFDLTH
jgi:hypothetical protein